MSSTGAVSWFHTDHQGSVIAVTNASGHTTATASYSPYGEFATPGQMPPGLGAGGGVFGYAGRQFDAETGLYQYRARYYHLRLGQFLSTDPIGTKDDPNLTLYVLGDPVNHMDPAGRELRVIGSPSFVERTAIDLKIISQGLNGGELVRDLIEHPQVVTIQESATGHNSTSYFTGRGPVDAIINYNPGGASAGRDALGSYERPPFVGLSHELGHAEDAVNGVGLPSSGRRIRPGSTPPEEINALRRENEVRNEHGLPQRPHYRPY